MRPLDSCQLCFQKSKSDFVEIYRNKFQSLRNISLKQELVDNVLKRYEIVMERGFGGSLTFHTRNENRQEVVDLLNGIGIPVHSLLDHISQFLMIYNSTRREKLGETAFVEIPAEGSWSTMNPATRKWDFLQVYRSEVSGANVKIHSILKQEYKGTKFYRVMGSKQKASVVAIEHLAAYNMMADQFEDRTAFWIEKPGGIAVISRTYLKNIPSDFFGTMVRLRPTESHIEGFLTFDNDDFPLVQKLLSLIRINLVMQSDVKIVQTRSTPRKITLLYLDSLAKERIELIVKVLKYLGGVVERSDNNISVTGKKKKIVLSFCDSPKSSIESGEMFISTEALEEPGRLEEVLGVIQATCGLNKGFLDFLIASNWPVINQKDLTFIIDAAVDFYKKDPEKAKQIILQNHDAMKNWYRDVISGKIRVEQDISLIIGKILKLILKTD